MIHQYANAYTPITQVNAAASEAERRCLELSHHSTDRYLTRDQERDPRDLARRSG